MKFKDIIIILAMLGLMLVLLNLEAKAQLPEDRIYHLINNKRDTRLMFDVTHYNDTYARAQEIAIDFALNDSCDCDGESIAGADSFDALMLKLADNYTYDWIHYDPNARYVCIAVVESDGMFYGVVRVWE